MVIAKLIDRRKLRRATMEMPSMKSFLTRAIRRVAMEHDGMGWRRQLAALRAEGQSVPVTRSVLFSDVMTTPATAKMEALMAGLLRTKGYRPIVVLRVPDRPIERIFLAAVSDVEFTYLDHEISAQEKEAAAAKAAEMVASLSCLRDLLGVEVGGFRVGINVLSIVLRQFRVGALEKNNAVHRACVENTLAQSLAVKGYVERFLQAGRPDIAIFNERGYTPAGEIFDGCTLAGVDTIQWCGAPQADRLVYRRYRSDDRGEHPLTLSKGTWEALQDMPWTKAHDEAIPIRIRAGYESGAWCSKQQLQDGKSLIGADRVRERLGLAPEKKTAVIFSHIFYDATFFYGKGLFEDYEQWLIETVRIASANPKLNWVVKVHPVNVWRSRMDGAAMMQLEELSLHAVFGKLPDHVKLLAADTDISTYSLFEIADYGITVRGTVGMELPCLGVPVVTAGTGRYSGRGFTVDPRTRGEYSDVLSRLHEMPRLSAHQIRLARLLYFASFELLPAPMLSFVLDFFQGKRLPDVFLRAPADSRLLDTKDLGRLIRWMTESRAVEFLIDGPV